MRDVWKHILNAVNEPLTFEYWFKLNEYVARNMKRWTGGTLRIGKIGISDTDYIPPIPKQETVIQELSNIFNGDISATKKALNAFVWGVKGRFLGMETSVQA